jgi:hypothetical protein
MWSYIYMRPSLVSSVGYVVRLCAWWFLWNKHRSFHFISPNNCRPTPPSETIINTFLLSIFSCWYVIDVVLYLFLVYYIHTFKEKIINDMKWNIYWLTFMINQIGRDSSVPKSEKLGGGVKKFFENFKNFQIFRQRVRGAFLETIIDNSFVLMLFFLISLQI